MGIPAMRLPCAVVAVCALVLVLTGCASRPAAPASTRSATSGTSTAATHSNSARSSSGSASATHTPATAAHVFAAFDSTGAPALGIRTHRSGRCFASSITVPDRSAYRCFAGNEILDPCFAETPSARTVVDCYADPWTAAVQLRLTAAPPTPGAPLKIAQPWAVQLSDGVRCVVTTGTTPLLRGVPMRYQCGTATAGLLDTAGPLLRAQVRTAGGSVTQVTVTATWTG
jgi:eukaryotic-like serine/threonine-protein kinase